jgi:D-glycero-D-manno-heptose 1,7-bisphosphate phosphatase
VQVAEIDEVEVAVRQIRIDARLKPSLDQCTGGALRVRERAADPACCPIGSQCGRRIRSAIAVRSMSLKFPEGWTGLHEGQWPRGYSPKRGTWTRLYRRPEGIYRPAIFLDRDGVMIEEVDHLHRPEDVVLAEGAADLIRSANAQAVPIVVVTNQAGIGRGLYDWAAFEAVVDRMVGLFREQAAAIDAIYACPFHPDAAVPYAHPSHPSRKPNPGMLLQAASELHLELAASWLIGDTASDIRAARAAGLAGAVHVLTGHGRAERADVLGLSDDAFEVRLAADAVEARRVLPNTVMGTHG